MTLSSSLRATDSLRGFIGDVKMIRTCLERHPGTNLRPTTWPPLSAARAGANAGLSVPLPGGAGELRPKQHDGCKRRQAFERIVVVRGRLEHSSRHSGGTWLCAGLTPADSKFIEREVKALLAI